MARWGLLRHRAVAKPVRSNKRKQQDALRARVHRGLRVEQFEERVLLSIGSWTPLGPAPIENSQIESVATLPGAYENQAVGAIQAVAAHPTNPSILYVGSANGGIWKTTNATTTTGSPTWTALTDQSQSLSIGSLAFDPTDPGYQTLVAGVGRFSDYNRAGGTLSGILRTVDGGAHWTTLDGGGVLAGKNCISIAARGNTILVAVDNALSGSYEDVGIYRSTDAGLTFQQVSIGDGSYNGLPHGIAYDLAGDPTNSNVFYTAVVGATAYGGFDGIYKTSNAGASWIKVSSTALDNFITSTGAATTHRIQLSVGNTGQVYVGIVNQVSGQPTVDQLAAVFHSNVGGTIWTQMDLPRVSVNGSPQVLQFAHTAVRAGDPLGILPSGQGTVHFSIAADPVNANIVYIGGDAQPTIGPTSPYGATTYSGLLLRGDSSQATGKQWASLTNLGPAGGGTGHNTSPAPQSREITFDAFDPQNPQLQRLIEVNDGGIYVRTIPRSAAGDWYSLNGNLQIGEFHEVAYDSISDIAIGVAQDTGVSEEVVAGGLLWDTVRSGEGGSVAVDDATRAAQGESYRYTSGPYLTNFERRTFDDAGEIAVGSVTVKPKLIVNGPGNQTFKQVDGGQLNTPIAINTVDPTRLVFGGKTAVFESSDGGDTLRNLTAGPNANAIVYGGRQGTTTNVSVLWVATDAGVFLRVNPTDTLARVNSYPGGAALDIVVDPRDWSKAYVTNGTRIYYTANAGVSWADITGAAVGIRALEFIAIGNNVGALVMAGSQGVFESQTTEPGVWHRLGVDLPNVPIYDLVYSAEDNVLVAGTMGRGVWELADARTETFGVFNLLSVTTNERLYLPTDSPTITTSPTQLTLLFNGGDKQPVDASTLDGIRVTRAGPNGLFYDPVTNPNDTDDVVVTPGWKGIGDKPNEVILRFAEALPSDSYHVTIVGQGIDGEHLYYGPDGKKVLPLTNTSGIPVQYGLVGPNGATYWDGKNFDWTFKLNLPPQVTAVVPQPIVRDPSDPTGVRLVQSRNTIEVYFSEGMDKASAENNLFYSLIATGQTADTADDLVVHPRPGQVVYDDVAKKVTLTFDRDTNGNVIGDLADLDIGAFRLRVGDEYQAISPSAAGQGGNIVTTERTDVSPMDAMDSAFVGATDLSSFTYIDPNTSQPNASVPQSWVISGDVGSRPYVLEWPGGQNTPGSRSLPEGATDISGENHIGMDGDVGPDGDIPIFYYNFQDIYGDIGGTPMHNLITEVQKERARDVFSLFHQYFGIEFVETADSGLIVATGDLRVFTDMPTGPGSPGGVAGGTSAGPAIVINSFYDLGNGEFGGGYMWIVMHELMHPLGLGHSFDRPGTEIMGASPAPAQSISSETSYPTNSNIVSGQFLYRKDSLDIDLYKFEVDQEGGTFSAETIAQRRAGSASLLDTALVLFDADGNVVARNDNYYGQDSFIGLHLKKGTYYVGVSASGNEQYDPNILDSGIGGTTQGDYELRLNFAPDVVSQLSDAQGIALDGDANATPGGDYNFWFNVQSRDNVDATQNHTIIVDKLSPGIKVDRVIGDGTPSSPYTHVLVAGDGTLANPYQNLSDALNAYYGAKSGDVVRVVGNNFSNDYQGHAILTDAAGLLTGADGQTFKISDATKTYTFELDNNSSLTDSRNIRIAFTAADTPASIAKTIADAINSRSWIPDGLGKPGVARYKDGLYVRATADVDSSGKPIIILTGPTVNIDLGVTKLRTSLQDNIAYEIGKNPSDQALADGAKLEVPQGVALLFDAGAVVKLRGANVDVGSSAEGIDRSLGSVQVLGTPGNSVYFTSYLNERVGNDSYGNVTAPGAGDWGGLVFRNNYDYEEQAADPSRQILEEEGIFLNYVNHADLSYGGGKVMVNGADNVFDPIHLFEARPTVSFSTITYSADAALSADPNSLEETLFHDDSTGNRYTADYTRVGPDLHGNTLTNNSLNALYLRVSTNVAQSLETLDVQARFDDTDMVLAISENLVIQGASGGAVEVGNVLKARIAGRLAIDPGAIVKLFGTRIEVGAGGQLIAEGTASHPITFTSVQDDTYGAGGTFDTSNNGAARAPAPGDWGGFYFNATSQGSIDHANIFYAGGRVAIEGGFGNFAPVDIRQATVRIANTRFQYNTATTTDDRNGRGSISDHPAVIYVRFAQPIIVNNEFRDNDAAAISMDVNALNGLNVVDWGRSTGAASLFDQYLGNFGPLVRGNRLENNAVNGMVVRGGMLTTEGIWDDTDIAHVVFDEIMVPNLDTYGALRLQSSATASLVVKLSGDTAGFTASGRALEITDRVGGTVQIIGTPADPIMGTPSHPVVLTAIGDDTVSAGFDPEGRPMSDTDNVPNSVGVVGSWRSVKLDEYSNDRNVAVAIEAEPDSASHDVNSIVNTSQWLGQLAQSPLAGDDVLRLGFEVHGTIAFDRPTDADVYSFKGYAGTQIWIALDRTSFSLDTVVEFVDANGNALRDNNGVPIPASNTWRNELSTSTSMERDTWGYEDLYSTNPNDAGMAIALPGPAGQQRTYYIRVTSAAALSPATPDGYKPTQTSGQYQLQLRLQPVYEHPGSTVRYADIRYATNGIEVYGLPGHSPLTVDTQETETYAAGGTQEAAVRTNTNDSKGTAQPIGNLLQSDQGMISLSGRLDDWMAGDVLHRDVDWYTFDVGYGDTIERIGGVTSDGSVYPVTFDIDYADGIVRPNTAMWIFDETGTLILNGTDSGMSDDLPNPASGTGFSDLTRGSVGTHDPFVGPVYLLEGHKYFVAITNYDVSPTAAASPTLRYEPVNSIQRLAEDNIGSQNASALAPDPQYTLFPGDAYNGDGSYRPDGAKELNLSAVPYSLSDVTLYTGSGSAIYSNDSYTGAIETLLPGTYTYADLAMRDDGKLVGISGGTISQIDIGSGTTMPTVSTGIVAYQYTPLPDPQTVPPTLETLQAAGTVNFEAIAYKYTYTYTTDPISASVTLTSAHTLYGIGNLDIDATKHPEVPFTKNLLYPISDSGLAPGAGGTVQSLGTDVMPLASLTVDDTGAAVGKITGMAFTNDGAPAGTTHTYNDSTHLYCVTDTGGLYEILDYATASLTTTTVTAPDGTVFNSYKPIDPAVGAHLHLIGTVMTDEATPQPVAFSGLSLGPQRVENGLYAKTLFATTTTGEVYALDPAATSAATIKQGALVDAKNNVVTGGAGVYGLAFSTLDFNMWHVTDKRAGDDGHDLNETYDQSRINTATTTLPNGGLSFYFGDETDIAPNGDIYHGNTYFGDLGTTDNTYDAPGGAFGSLQTQPFSLAGYSKSDVPTLYFDYLLDNGNTTNDPRYNLDTARVFASADGVTWHVLNASLVNPNGNLDSTGGQWKQFRLIPPANPDPTPGPGQVDVHIWSLADFAGCDSVRLRFDFTSAGDMHVGAADTTGSYLGAVSGELINDGDGFWVDGNHYFEFDMGVGLRLPNMAGDTIPADRSGETPETFRITGLQGASTSRTFEFDRDGSVAAGNVAIPLKVGATSAEVAQEIADIINSLNLTSAAITGAPAVKIVADAYQDRVMLNGARGVAQPGSHTLIRDDGNGAGNGSGVHRNGATPIAITSMMSAAEVAEAVAAALGAAFDVGAPIKDASGASVSTFKVDHVNGNSVIHIVGHSVQADYVYDELTDEYVQRAGPLPYSSSLDGDHNDPLIPYNNNDQFNNFTRAQGNAHEGFYIDNIMIGFGERGEMVTQAPVGTTDFTNPTPVKGDLVKGAYQLQIRQASEYATWTPDDLDKPMTLDRSFDVNDRLNESYTLTVPSAFDISLGSGFSISDGVSVVTFQFVDDDTYTGSDPRMIPVSGSQLSGYYGDLTAGDSAAEVAAKVVAAINGAFNAGLFKASATTNGTSDRVELFGAAKVTVTSRSMLPSGGSTPTHSDEPKGLIRDYQSVADATPVGTSYMLTGPSNWGGSVSDAEKDKNPMTQDDYMDWAAAASNVLAWSGWGQVNGLTTADEIFKYLQDEWQDWRGWSLDAWMWWFTGENPDADDYNAASVYGSGGGFFPSLDPSDYIQTETDAAQAMSAVGRFLQNGDGVVVGLECNATPGPNSWNGVTHAITVWGYTQDTAGQYTGVYVTDSDDNKDTNNAATAPDNLHYYAVQYSSADDVWYLQDYFGRDTFYIDEVSGLRKRFSDTVATTYAELGDENQLYDQGQVILESNQITHSANFGIIVGGTRQVVVPPTTPSVDPYVVDPNPGATPLPHPGPTAPLREVNTANQVPGVVIQNNVLAFGQNGGIKIAGYEDSAGKSVGSVPFARIVNNTIYGTGSTAQYRNYLTFEDIPNKPDGTAITEGMSLTDLIDDAGTPTTINDWLKSNYGVSFKYSNDTYPRLAQVGALPAGAKDGYAFDNPTTEGDSLVTTETANIGKFFLTDNTAGNNTPASPVFLNITYEDGAAAASGVILDIDGSEQWTIRSYDSKIGGNLLQTLVIGNSYPHTDNGLATPWNLTKGTIWRIEIEYTGPAGTASGAGFAFDNFLARGANTGIDVGKNASPTILNNVIASMGTGIKVYYDPVKDPTYVPTTVVGTTAYYNNGRNTAYVDASGAAGWDVSESFAIPLAADPFVNAAAGNFYPAVGSGIIDSSLDSLLDRPNMVNVRDPLGIPLSPILAPSFDLYGQLRMDDPSVVSPSGMSGVGSSIYKDRGAIDRVDFAGPTAALTSPMDDDGNGDVTLAVTGGALGTFVIQLGDQGAGIDNATVTVDKVHVKQGDVDLTAGLDYFFTYDSTNHTIKLESSAGVWDSRSTYTITLDDTVRDSATNALQPNRMDGTTMFTVSGFDFGDAPMMARVPDPKNPGQYIVVDATKSDPDDEIAGARHIVAPGIALGSTITSEFDAHVNDAATGDAGDDGVMFPGSNFGGAYVISPNVGSATATIVVTTTLPTGVTGKLDAWIDWNNDGVWDPSEKIAFAEGADVENGQNNLTFTVQPGWAPNGAFKTYARFRLSATGNLSDGTPMQPTGEAADGEVEDYQISVVPYLSDLGDAPMMAEIPDPQHPGQFITVDATRLPTGAGEAVLPGFSLGATVSSESNPQVNATASGDTDDDGFDFSNVALVQGHDVPVTFTVTNPGGQSAFLNAWIDFNGDGVWSANEQVAQNLPVTNGENTLTIHVPQTTDPLNPIVVGNTFARFRLSTAQDPLSLPIGDDASGGEVEDYRVAILPRPGAIQGHVWDDRSNDGSHDPAEPGLAGWTVYIDRDGNGQFDELTDISTTTDANGLYTFDYDLNLAPGTYSVREVLQTGFTQTPTDASCVVTVVSDQITGNADFVNHDSKSPALTDLTTVAPALRNTPVDAPLSVTFSEPLDTTSVDYKFDYRDLSLTRNNVAVPLSSLTATVSLVPGTTTYQITLASSLTSAEGSYVLTVSATGVKDLSGNIGSGFRTVSWVMDTTHPKVMDVIDVATDPLRTPVSSIGVVMKKIIDLSTFTKDDLILTRDDNPGTPIDLTGVTVIWTSGTTYTINGLSTHTTGDGRYTLTVVGAGISDLAGNAGDNTESTSWTMDTTSPKVQAAQVVTPAPSQPVSSVQVVLSEMIVLSSFTYQDVSLTRDTVPVELTNAVTVSWLYGTTYLVTGLADFTSADGNYELTVRGDDLQDKAGNAGADTASDAWTRDASTPIIVAIPDVTPNPRNTLVSSIEVIMSETLNPLTFDYTDLTLTRDNTSVVLNGTVKVELEPGTTTYRISGLNGFTSLAGKYVLTVDGDTVEDTAGNLGSGTVSSTWTMDSTAPSITNVIDVTPDPRNASVSSIRVVFSEAIDLATCTYENLTLTLNNQPVVLTDAVTISLVSGTTYQISGLSGFTAADGTYELTVIADGIQDKAGNFAANSASDSWIKDTVAPTVTAVHDVTPNPRNASVSSIEVEMSEPIDLSTFNYQDLALTRNGTSVSLTGAVSVTLSPGTTSTYLVSGLSEFTVANGTYVLTVNANEIRDPAGNVGSDFATTGWLTDAVAPTVSISLASPSLTYAATVDFLVQFSEIVNGVSAADFAIRSTGLTAPFITQIVNNGAAYTVTVNTGSGSGTLGLDLLNDGTILDQAGNHLVSGASSQDYSIDKGVPAVVSSVRAEPSPTTASTVAFMVTFNEDVLGVDAGDFAINASAGLAAASVSSVTKIDGRTYSVAVSTGPGDGTLQLKVLDNGTIHDQTGNLLGGLGAHDGDFLSGETYNIDRTHPTDISLSNANVAEHVASGALVGLLNSTGPHTGAYTYAFVSGPGSDDNGSFELVGDRLLTKATFDFVAKSVYTVRIRTTDSANYSYEEAFQIDVLAQPHPTDISLSNDRIAEGAATGSLVGLLTSTGPQAGAYSYELIAGAGDDDNDSFRIVGDLLKTDTTFDFAAKSVYTIRIRTTDSAGYILDETFTVNIVAQADTLSIGDHVWNDLVANGLQDATEPGIAGAAVELFWSPSGVVGSPNDGSLGQTVTDAAGHYRFDGLLPGLSYYVVFRAPAGYTFTTPNVGANDAVDSDANAAGVTGIFSLNAGSDATLKNSFDAGLVAPASRYDFAFGAGSANDDQSQAIATDSAGNVYVAGLFRGTTDFDPGPGVFNLTSVGGSDAFVAKYSSAGTLLWVRAVGGVDEDSAAGIALGPNGDIYVTGSFGGTADFLSSSGGVKLTSAGGKDAFVLQLDNGGSFGWAVALGGAGEDLGNAIAVDNNGSAFITGSFQGTADFNPDSVAVNNLVSVGPTDAFVTKLDSAGNLAWVKRMGGIALTQGRTVGSGIALAGDGSVYTTGSYQGTADFDPSDTHQVTLTSAGDTDVFVAKFNSLGDFGWASGMGGTGADYGADLVIAGDGSVYSTGGFYGIADFNPGTDIFTLDGAGNHRTFISKLNADGNFVWARQMGGTGGDIASGITLGADGSVYTTGGLWGSAYFAAGPGTETYLSVTSAGKTDAFLLNVSAAGSFISIQRMGGNGDDCGNGLAVSPSGVIYSTGYFQGTADFDPSSATSNLTSTGGRDLFVSKYAMPLAVTVSQAPSQVSPTVDTSVVFRVAFTTPVSDFTYEDVILGGTAPGTRYCSVASVGTDGAVYDVTVKGMTGSGTVTLGVAADKVWNASGKVNTASASNATVVYSTSKPALSTPVVGETAALSNNVFENNEYLVITFNATSPNGIASKTVMLDGKYRTITGGPNFSSPLGKLAAGTHSYTVSVTDSLGLSTSASGTFTVVAPTAAPNVGSAAVAEAGATKNGRFDPNEKLVLTWTATSAKGISSQTVTVDGRVIRPITAVNSAQGKYSCAIGGFASGTHTYTIRSVNSKGVSTIKTGQFTVVTPPAMTKPVVAEAVAKNGRLNARENLAISWTATSAKGIASQTLTIDGRAFKAIKGPDANGKYTCGIGTWAAGTHTFTVRSTDSKGVSSTRTGKFAVGAALMVDAATAAQGSASVLTDAQLDPVAAAAIRRLTLLLGSRVETVMAGVNIKVENLPDGMLGETIGNTILIDDDAAGYGWFVDSTPADDAEFATIAASDLVARPGSAAARHVDLLSTVMHEMGHELGFEHSNAVDLMNPSLGLGERRLMANSAAAMASAVESLNHHPSDKSIFDEVFASSNEDDKKDWLWF